MGKRIDETPVRRRTGIVAPIVVTPGTPPAITGAADALRIIKPTDVQVMKYAGRYRRALNLASASPLDGYLSDLLPVVPLAQFNPEDLYPDDVLMSGVQQAISAGGQIGQLMFFNPKGSPVLAIIERLYVANSVADTVQVAWGNAALGSVPTNEARNDSRAGTTVIQRFLSLQVGAATGGGAGTAFEFYILQAGVMLPFPLGPYIVAPGVGLTIFNTTLGVATLTGTFKYRLLTLPQG